MDNYVTVNININQLIQEKIPISICSSSAMFGEPKYLCDNRNQSNCWSPNVFADNTLAKQILVWTSKFCHK